MTAIEYNYLTDSDKHNIIESHVKALEHSLYNVEISQIEASATGSDISTYASQISDFQARISALNVILNQLNVGEI